MVALMLSKHQALKILMIFYGFCPQVMKCAVINLNRNQGHLFLKTMEDKKELDEIVIGCAVGVLNNMDQDMDHGSVRTKVQKMMYNSVVCEVYSVVCYHTRLGTTKQGPQLFCFFIFGWTGRVFSSVAHMKTQNSFVCQ